MWLVPLLAFVGRRVWVYVALYAIHLTLAGIALACIATGAGTGETDSVFWLCYGWVALQALTGPRLFLPTALALTAVAVQATQGDRDGWFWLAFSWLALLMLGGGVLLRAARLYRRRTRAGAAAGTDPPTGPEAVFGAVFGGRGFSWPPGASPGSSDGDVVDGSAREVSTDLASELERLAALHATGELTDEEYAQAKQRLLG